MEVVFRRARPFGATSRAGGRAAWHDRQSSCLNIFGESSAHFAVLSFGRRHKRRASIPLGGSGRVLSRSADTRDPVRAQETRRAAAWITDVKRQNGDSQKLSMLTAQLSP